MFLFVSIVKNGVLFYKRSVLVYNKPCFVLAKRIFFLNFIRVKIRRLLKWFYFKYILHDNYEFLFFPWTCSVFFYFYFFVL